MNFLQLKAIVKNIKTHVTCPKCNNSYSSHDLSVISAMGNRCLIVAKCDECHTPIMISAVVRNEGEDKNGNPVITEQQRIMDMQDFEEIDTVSSDDVVKIHQMLNDYQGNFEDLFKEE